MNIRSLNSLNPCLGRFVNRDPIGYVDGMNLYGGYFAESFGVDPMGLSTGGLPGNICCDIATPISAAEGVIRDKRNKDVYEAILDKFAEELEEMKKWKNDKIRTYERRIKQYEENIKAGVRDELKKRYRGYMKTYQKKIDAEQARIEAQADTWYLEKMDQFAQSSDYQWLDRELYSSGDCNAARKASGGGNSSKAREACVKDLIPNYGVLAAAECCECAT